MFLFVGGGDLTGDAGAADHALSGFGRGSRASIANFLFGHDAPHHSAAVRGAALHQRLLRTDEGALTVGLALVDADGVRGMRGMGGGTSSPNATGKSSETCRAMRMAGRFMICSQISFVGKSCGRLAAKGRQD